MSFFFTQQTLEAKRAGPRKGMRAASLNKQNAATLQRLGCAACPLNTADVDTPKMPPTLVKGTTVYFLGQAPGAHEDETSGRPMTGPAGKLLRECIPPCEAVYCSFDNVIRDRPPKDREADWKEIECCRNHVITSIEQAKPRLIVGLGLIPLQWALGSTDMPGMRGRIFAVQMGTHHCWFMPTYDPAFITKIAYNKDDPLRSRLGHCLKMDVKRAFTQLDTLPEAKADTEAEARAGTQGFDGSTGYEALLGLLKRTSEAPIAAVDLETSCLRPYAVNARILTVAFSFADVHFSFALDHPKARWTELQKVKIKHLLQAILTSDNIKIAHNAPFELEWFIKLYDEQIVNHLAWECTQMQAHFIDERRGKQHGGDDGHRSAYQNLDFLCKQHFGIAYKSMFKLNKKDMANADLGETLIYNAVDTKYTLKLWHRQNALLKGSNLLKAYREALPRQATVAVMQYLGIAVDQSEIQRNKEKLGQEIAQISAAIDNLKVIKAYRADHGEFNPQGQDLMVVFKDYLKCPEIVIDEKHNFDFDKPSQTKKDIANKVMKAPKYSLDKKVLDQINHPLAQLIVDLRNRSKLKGTYVDGLEQGSKDAVMWPDGKLHTNFNTTFTETGRLSSDEPNQQNWPKRNDSWVRKAVVAPKGHKLLAFDYGQLEGCTAAICSKDKVLIKALWEEYDTHMEWTQKLIKRYPAFIEGSDFTDKKVAKSYRSIIKNKFVFPAIFGAQNESIAGYLNVPLPVIDDLMKEFWSTFSGLAKWQDVTVKNYYDTGYVVSPTGRRHHYPLTRNQVINFPIQGFAGDIVCDAMCTLSQHAIETDQMWLHPILNIHDDLSFVVPDAKVDESIEAIYRVMLTPPYDFISVPLSVEVSVGQNWFEMREIGKYWSHRDV